MPSPALIAASKSTRTEASVRAEWRERFIQKQLAGLKALGLSQEALAREEKLLRTGASPATIARLTGAATHVV